VAAGRILVVHESGATRSLLTALLTAEGLHVEAIQNWYEAMARFVDEPADLVLLGLVNVREPELELIRALKREEPPPRILVTFPSPLRDLAVRALVKGADGYVLEPFYGNELVGAVRGQLTAAEAPEGVAALARLAQETAHAVGNPLQVLTLLLQKERVTKKELMTGIPEHLARIEAVVGHLRAFGAVGDARPEPRDVRPIVERAAADAGHGYDTQAVPLALIDATLYADAVAALLEAVALRAAGAELTVRLVAEEDAVALRLPVAREAFADEDTGALPDAVFVVRPDRQVHPGLARVRLMLERQGGSLAVEQKGAELILVARVPLAP
jgi:DNA-binding response OmpR family regulator